MDEGRFSIFESEMKAQIRLIKETYRTTYPAAISRDILALALSVLVQVFYGNSFFQFSSYGIWLKT